LGVWHSAAGQRYSPDTQPHVYLIVEEARKRGIFTVGIGDGGNEIGFGLINKEATEIYRQTFGVTCLCGCGGGQATATATDVLVSASISNWGAYGISAMLAYMKGNPLILQDPDTERRMLEAAVGAGAVAAGSLATIPWVDYTSPEAQQAVVTLLREIVVNALRRQSVDKYPVVKGVFEGPAQAAGK